jgi:poly(3-hydroxybutyrate) depolymerase
MCKLMTILAAAVFLFISACPTSAQTVSGGDINISMPIDGETRTAILHVPLNYNPQRAYPLMLMFHGEDGSAQGIETTTDFDSVADANGFFVVYPETAPNSTDAEWDTALSSPDVGFIDALVTNIESTFTIDATSVYVSGFSHGAGMVHTLACLSSIQLAGLADVSEDLNDSTVSGCPTAQNIPVVIFHGTCDPISPYENGASGAPGGSGGAVWSAQSTTEFWLQNNSCGNPVAFNPLPATPAGSTTPASQEMAGCSASSSNPSGGVFSLPRASSTDPVNTFPTDVVVNNAGSTLSSMDIDLNGNTKKTRLADIVQTWSGCANDANVTFYTIPYGGHEWPGNVPKNDLGYASEDLNASAIIWQTLSANHAVNGTCGPSSNSDLPGPPTTGLCLTGTASPVTGTDSFNWTCAGSNGGSNASCSALPIINGSCGASDNMTLTAAPTANLCGLGQASTVVTGTGPWSWVCAGSNGGSNASCEANLSPSQNVSISVIASGSDYLGAPIMNVLINGSVIGTVNVTALHSQGQWQTFSFNTTISTNLTSAGVAFINDLYNAATRGDRNLWVKGITVNGQTYLPSNGVYLNKAGTGLLAQNGTLTWSMH